MDIEAVFREGEDLFFAGDGAKAEPLLRRAAEAGHANAASLLGEIYQAAGDITAAIHWHRMAAARGDTDAAAAALALHNGPP